MRDALEIGSRDYWVKIVGMLQQNWALVDSDELGRSTVFFIDDGSAVFDQLQFERPDEAKAALLRNGFSRFRESPNLQEFMDPPPPPFGAGAHPNGKIYSSGRFWR